MDKWARLLRNIYLTEKSRNRKKAVAARRDQYRHIQGVPIIYSYLHEVRIPNSEFEPDLLRDTEFMKDSLHPTERRKMQGRDT